MVSQALINSNLTKEANLKQEIVMYAYLNKVLYVIVGIVSRSSYSTLVSGSVQQ